MPIEGIDFAYGLPALTALADKAFVIRYIVPGRAVSIGAAEVQHWRNAGKELVGVWERAPDRALAGRAAGKADALDAVRYAVSVGAPADLVPYMAADDWGALDADMPAIGQYMLGVADAVGVGRRAAYGGVRTIRWLFDHQLIDYGWQTYAWSGGVWDPRAQLRQYQNNVSLGGAQVDLDRAMTADYGQWNGADMPTPGDLWGFNITNPASGAAATAAARILDIQTKLTELRGAVGATYNNVSAVKGAVSHVAAQVGAQADDEKVLLAALSAMRLTLTDEQVAQLAAAFPHVDEARIADAVRLDLAEALAGSAEPQP